MVSESENQAERFPPANPMAEFREQCRKLTQNTEFAALPDITFAMYPEDVRFRDDISNPKFFNDRFIEPRLEGNGAFVARLAMSGFTMSLVTVLVLAPLFGEYERISDMFGALIICVPFALMAWFFLWFASGGNTGGAGLRFNRQAQVVHRSVLGKVVHLPWRDVKPFLELGSIYGLDLFFPIPYSQLTHLEPIAFKRVFRGRPVEVGGNFDAHDSAFADSLMLRLEFIRRYMEHGLDAIQPHPDAIASGELRVPSGFVTSKHSIWRRMLSPATWAYWLAAGPWVDRYIKRKADAYRWPEEVERLCAPGADLTGYDTTPVKSHRNVFYRWTGMQGGFEFVDANGRKLPMHAADKAKGPS